MSIQEIAKYAKIKGFNLVGTGDFTHPKWLKEIQETLTPDADSGLLKLDKHRVAGPFYASNRSLHNLRL